MTTSLDEAKTRYLAAKTALLGAIDDSRREYAGDCILDTVEEMVADELVAHAVAAYYADAHGQAQMHRLVAALKDPAAWRADRAAAVAAIDAEIARLRAERDVLTTEVVQCRSCNEDCVPAELTRGEECRRCASGELSDPDAEHRSNYYASIAGGCER